MAILEALLEQIAPGKTPVRHLAIGVHWTAVCSRGCGLASSLVGEGPHGHTPIRDVGQLHTRSAQELAGWAQSDNLLEASIGMAAINSLLDAPERGMQEINAAEIIARQSAGKNLAVIGHFPFVDRLRAATRNLWVIEKRPAEGDYPEQAAGLYLPQADVVAISGTTLINHTLEPLLALCPREAFVVLLGPSTPLSPLFFDYGVDLVSGAQVVDEAAAMLTIQQGAIFPQVKGVRLVSLAKRE